MSTIISEGDRLAKESLEVDLEEIERLRSLKSLTKHSPEDEAKLDELCSQLAMKIKEWKQSAPQIGKEVRKAKVEAMFIEGRLLAAEGNADAEALLTQAVKLDPLNVKGWDALGALFWEKGDSEMARDCYLACLEHKRDKRILRNLSMITRKLGGPVGEKVSILEESVKLAKEALSLDYDDEESWYVLGNTYLELFFSSSHNTKDLESALKAYKRSEAIQRSKGDLMNPDLFFNRAQVLGYLEDFKSAVDDYRLAKELDNKLPTEERIDAIGRKVAHAAQLVSKKGHMKPKRLLQLTQSLGQDSSTDIALHNDGTSFSSSDLLSLDRVESITDLKQGDSNRKSRLDIRVLLPLSRSNDPPVSFLAVDRVSNVFVLSVYHLDSGILGRVKPERDRITIVGPVVRQVDFAGLQYPLIHLNQPGQFFVNGEPMISSFAPASFDSTTQT